MEAKAKQTYIRMPARKIRRVINAVRGKSVQDAVNTLKFMPYFAARVVEKNIKDAAANAVERWGVLQEELVVSEAFADDGPTYKRARPRAQGRIYRIQKRTSHLTVKVKVCDELKEKLKEQKKKAKAAKKSKKAEKVETKKVEEVVEQEVIEASEQNIEEKQVEPKAEVVEQDAEPKAESTENVSEDVSEDTNQEENK